MDEKRDQNTMPSRSRPPFRSRRLFSTVLFGLVLVGLGYNIWRSNTAHLLPHKTALNSDSVSPSRDGDNSPATRSKLVPLEAHIISKCPDTRDALRSLILPVMQQVYDKVNFTLSYIGTPTANDGVQCKHGPSECMGNIIELCARELYPDPKTNLGFIMCLTRDYSSIPDRTLVEDCALEHAIDIQKLNDCAAGDDGAHGLELLRNSVQRTADAGVTISCTIRLNNETYCIRDGGQWIDCPHGPGVNDLVLAIEKLYHSS